MSAVTQLSRAEVMTLLYDKVMLIRGEAEEIEDEPKPAKISEYKARLKRIMVEAKRAASLIDTYERTWKVGHCLHCGETYDDHAEFHQVGPLPPGAPRVKPKNLENPPPRCNALRKFFESAEIETYQGVRIDEVG